MTKADYEAFDKLLTGVAVVLCPKEPISAMQRQLYFETLSDLSIEEFRVAAHHLMGSYKFNLLPKPVDFLDAARPNVEDMAALAYDVMNRAFREHGAYESVQFNDPFITAALYAWGGETAWVKINEVSKKDEVWFRKEFERLYTIYASSGKQVDVQHLSGLFEEQNRLNGREVKPPVLVGIERKELGSGQKGITESRK